MKVYILIGWRRYDSDCIISVHESESSALKASQEDNKKRLSKFDGYTVEEYEVKP